MNTASEILVWLQQQPTDVIKLDWNQPWLEIKLHRPACKNALNSSIIQQIKQVFDYIESAAVIRGVIITGGAHEFCAGADLQEIAQLRAQGTETLIANNKQYGELLHRIHLCRVPVIAMVDGPALGGGMGLACASDLIYATEAASFGMPEPKIGIIAGQIFPYVYRKLGLPRTQEMALQGLRIDGNTSFQWGLSNQVFGDYAALETGVKSVLEHIKACGPLALLQTKVMLNRLYALEHNYIEQTARIVANATLSSEGQEGSTAFLEKRKPNWNY